MNAGMRVYNRSPVWVQNLMLSAYGLHLRRLRSGSTGREMLTGLRQSQWLPAASVRAMQNALLRETVAAAARDVPFYRQRGLRPLGARALDEMSAIPLLSKSEVQAAGRDCVSDRYRGRRLNEVHTGGTTGKPLAVYCDAGTLQRNYAFFSRFKEQAGIGPGQRTATFAGRTLVPANAQAPYWRHNHSARTMLFSSYHIGERSLAAYVEALTAFRPSLIDSYPSSIEPIARYVVEHDIASVRPAAVITSSETLFPEVRALIERAFSCRVFDHYGGAEMAALVTQCDAGTYHVVPEFGVVEVLRDGRPARPGERGEIVATGFINPVMPLIRYSTGDSAVMGDGSCSCGRSTQTLERIEGRMDDVVVTPEGHLVGRLDPIFKAVSSLQETRIVQDAVDHVRVEMVVAVGVPPTLERDLEVQLRARLGPTMRIDIERVSAIPRTQRGKLRTTVNLVYQRSRDGMQRV